MGSGYPHIRDWSTLTQSISALQASLSYVINFIDAQLPIAPQQSQSCDHPQRGTAHVCICTHMKEGLKPGLSLQVEFWYELISSSLGSPSELAYPTSPSCWCAANTLLL